MQTILMSEVANDSLDLANSPRGTVAYGRHRCHQYILRAPHFRGEGFLSGAAFDDLASEQLQNVVLGPEMADVHRM